MDASNPNLVDLAALRIRIEADLARAEKDVAWAKERLSALAIIERDEQQNNVDTSSLSLPSVETAAPISGPMPTTFAGLVRMAVAGLKGHQFTLDDVQEALKRMKVPLPTKNLRTRITVELIPMHTKGVLEIVHRGTGKTLNRYQFIGFPENGEGASRAPSVSNLQH